MPETVPLLACAIADGMNRIMAGDHIIMVLAPFLIDFPQITVNADQDIIYSRADRPALISMIMAANAGQSLFVFQLQEMATTEHGDARYDHPNHPNHPNQSHPQQPVDESTVYSDAIQTAANGRSILLLGAPGVGRTRLLLNICYRLQASGKRVLVLSATQSGMAAFGACGATKPSDDAPDLQPEMLNNALGLWMLDRGSEAKMLKCVRKWNKRVCENWARDVIAIDNISALTADRMDQIISLSRATALRSSAQPPPQFILAGNFTTGRPCVYNKATDRFEQARYATQASTFGVLDVRSFILRVPHRQHQDAMLAGIVQRLSRHEPLTDEQTMALRGTVHEHEDVRTGRITCPGRRADSSYTHLFLKKEHSDEFNTAQQVRLAASQTEHTYRPVIGHVKVRLLDQVPQQLLFQDLETLKFRFPTSSAAVTDARAAITASQTALEYTLCIGSRVMLTTPIRPAHGQLLPTGIQGDVVGFDETTGVPRVRFRLDESTETVNVGPVEFTGTTNSRDFEVILLHVPLALCWAMTITMASGLTLQKVMVHMGRAHGFGTHCEGKALDAIGRVRRLADLIIGTEVERTSRKGGIEITHEDLNMELFRVDTEVMRMFEPSSTDPGTATADVEAALGRIPWIRDADMTQPNGAANRYSWMVAGSVSSGRTINFNDSPPDVIRQALNGRPPLVRFAQLFNIREAEHKREEAALRRQTKTRIKENERKRHEAIRAEIEEDGMRAAEQVMMNLGNLATTDETTAKRQRIQ